MMVKLMCITTCTMKVTVNVSACVLVLYNHTNKFTVLFIHCQQSSYMVSKCKTRLACELGEMHSGERRGKPEEEIPSFISRELETVKL